MPQVAGTSERVQKRHSGTSHPFDNSVCILQHRLSVVRSIVTHVSLTHGLVSPRTPLRQFLDRELSAGVRPLRRTYQMRLPTRPLILPGEGVGFEAGTVGTAVDQRLRLAFTCTPSVDAATFLGWDNCRVAAGRRKSGAIGVLAEVGEQLLQRLTDTVASLRLDDRDRPLVRTDEEEEQFAHADRRRVVRAQLP